MSKMKIRTRVMTTAAALTLVPALALAQGTSTQGSQSGSSSSGSTVSPSAEPSQQGRSGSSQSGSSTHSGSGGTHSESSATQSGSTGTQSGSTPMGASQGQSAQSASQSAQGAQSQAAIDPAQVQRVFGMDVSLIDLSSLDNQQVRQLQQALLERGHYRGQVDGIIGPQTRAALTALLAQQYSLNQRLVNQGQITQQLASSIGIDAQGRTPVSGVDSPSQMQQQPGMSPSRSTSPSTRSPSGQQGSSPSPSTGTSPSDDPSSGDVDMGDETSPSPGAPR